MHQMKQRLKACVINYTNSLLLVVLKINWQRHFKLIFCQLFDQALTVVEVLSGLVFNINDLIVLLHIINDSITNFQLLC